MKMNTRSVFIDCRQRAAHCGCWFFACRVFWREFESASSGSGSAGEECGKFFEYGVSGRLADGGFSERVAAGYGTSAWVGAAGGEAGGLQYYSAADCVSGCSECVAIWCRFQPPPVITPVSGASTGRDNFATQVTDLAVPGAVLNDVMNTVPLANPAPGTQAQINQLVLGFPALGFGQFSESVGLCDSGAADDDLSLDRE